MLLKCSYHRPTPSPGRAGEFKWQMANGKIQMVFHLPFALCRLPFEIAF
jgi:hypothetical protein